MITYKRERKKLIIPSGFIYGSSGSTGCEEAIEQAYQDGYNEGYEQGQEDCPDCPSCNLENKQFPLNEGFTPTTVSPSQEYDGLGSVYVYDNGYGEERYNQGYQDGQSSVNLQSGSYTLTSDFDGDTGTIQPSEGYNGFTEFRVVDDGYGDSKYQSGWTNGFSSGETTGFNSGWTSGFNSGLTSGYNSGTTDGFSTGYSSGKTDGMALEKYKITFYAHTEYGGYFTPIFILDGVGAIRETWDGGQTSGNCLWDCDVRIGHITEIRDMEIRLHRPTFYQDIQPPTEIDKVRVNGAEYIITAQTKEYLGVDKYSDVWAYHLSGVITDIPVYGFRNFTSILIAFSGVTQLTDTNNYFPYFGLADRVTEDTAHINRSNIGNKHISVGQDITTYAINFKLPTRPFLWNNLYIREMYDNTFVNVTRVGLQVPRSDTTGWDADWKPLYILMNGHLENDNTYVGGFKIPITNFSVSDLLSDSIVITMYLQ